MTGRSWWHRTTAAHAIRRGTTTNPRVTISAGGYTGTFVGREVSGAERDRLWDLAKAFIPSYADYERLAGARTIPVLTFTEVG